MYSYNVNTLKLNGKGYPNNLINIQNPPKELFYIGSGPEYWIKKPKVAIVGSRKMSAYGKAVTKQITNELCNYGVVIISGLAYGVDITAHQSAIDNGNITVAVLPTSLDQIYPAAHLNSAKSIVDMGGTLLTEYPPRTINYKINFIARNRIVSGLADVLLITEAAFNSGSLHTARFALEQGKTVMAIPGNINSPGSEGCNNLIKSGAILTTSVDDILFELKINPKTRKTPNYNRGSKSEQEILKFISEGISSQEELALASNLDGPSVISAITSLEIAGAIRSQGGGNWTLA